MTRRAAALIALATIIMFWLAASLFVGCFTSAAQLSSAGVDLDELHSTSEGRRDAATHALIYVGIFFVMMGVCPFGPMAIGCLIMIFLPVKKTSPSHAGRRVA